MHFGQTLEANSIPEWKSQYIDFKQGKKLIAKLDKQFPDFERLPPPAMSNAVVPSVSPAPTAAELDDRSPLLAFTPRQSYTSPSEDYRKYEKKQFFKWVSDQTMKVSKFYTEQLNDASQKLAALTIQLAHFDVHRHEHQLEKRRLMPQKTTKTLLSTLDLPSLPAVFQNRDLLNRPRRFVSRVAAHRSDFNNKDDHVGYYQAKSMLRTATLNFYLSLVQLKEYRGLNETALRKIVKKFDKQLHFSTLDQYNYETRDLSFKSGRKLDEIMTSVEQLFSHEFTKGNHKLAMELLTSHSSQTSEPHNASVMLASLFLGATVPLLVLAIVAARNNPHIEATHLLQMYAGFALIALMLLGVGACMLAWVHFKINYPFIFDFDGITQLDYREYFVLPGLFAFALALFGWLTFNTPQDFHRYYPCLFLGISVAVLALPTYRHVQGHARGWLLHSLWRLLLSGLYPVEFRDLMLGDLMCSLTYPMSNIEFFFCIYATPHWWSDGNLSAQRCTSRYSRSYGFLACLPGIWRFLQCFRRFGDTLDWFPHLLNAGKYSFNILYNMSLSIARISPENTGLRAMFITFALINGVYSGVWDVFMDFSLMPAKTPRPVLVYPLWSYYVIMVLDFAMRQNWVMYVAFWHKPEHGAAVGFFVALIEASRRVLWLLFRVENEHAANIARCRAFKELTLPYDDVDTVMQSTDEEASSTSSERRTVPAQFLRRTSSVISSPRVKFAHTNDFERRKPRVVEEDEDDDDD